MGDQLYASPGTESSGSCGWSQREIEVGKGFSQEQPTAGCRGKRGTDDIQPDKYGIHFGTHNPTYANDEIREQPLETIQALRVEYIRVQLSLAIYTTS